MELTDWLTIALVFVGVWTFVPRRLRRALYASLSPAVGTLLDTLHDGATVLRKVVTHVAYRGLLGVPVPDAITVKPEVVSDEMPSEPEPLSSDEILLPSGAEPQANGSSYLAELQLNAAEVIALHRMIEHNKTAAKPSKSSTIQAGFGVSRGGSSAYQRASLIYDALFGAPVSAIKYRERTPEQEALRQQLRLGK